jgi:hypothetical protein
LRDWAMVDQGVAALDGEFQALYWRMGCPSLPLEYLLHATLLQILYSVLSERLLAEQIDFNLLSRPMPSRRGDFALRQALLDRRGLSDPRNCFNHMVENRSERTNRSRTRG